MRVPVGLALLTLPLWACLSAPQPADPGASDAAAQGDGNAGADADPIGAWQNDGAELAYFAGAIDEVRVWAHARTELEVQGARLEPLVGSQDGLVGYWQFDDKLVDSSPSGNTLVGFSPEYCAGPSN